DDFLVGNADGLRERGARAHFPHDGFPGQCTGDLAVVMAAHSVGHQPQAQLAVAVVAVLVELAPQADVGQVSEFDHWRAIVAITAPGSLAMSTESSMPQGHCTSGANDDPGAGPGSSLSACLAERGGFEPPRRYKRLPDFESGTFNHSATSPVGRAAKVPWRARNDTGHEV